ncbi:MAG: type II secretion system F family protein [archaeon]
MLIYENIAKRIPGLKLKLLQAHMLESPEQYIKKTVMLAFYITIGLFFFLFAFFKTPWLILALPFVFVIAFFYFLRYTDLKVLKIEKQINEEIIFAGRFLIIEVESGVPIYTAFLNISRNYRVIGRYFGEIIEKVEMGTGLEDALNESIDICPSANLRKILWQVLNSLRTGSDIARSLNVAINQMVREQQITVQEYGRKLSPLAMFYMMAAIIVPSLGMTMLVIMSTFIGIKLQLVVLLSIAGGIAFIQFMFLAVIRSQRPPIGI